MTAALPPLDHVVVLSDDVGIIQHAVENVPDRATGYCTDDVARAFIVMLQRLELADDATAQRLAGIYLAFLQSAQLADGRFHNFMSYERHWLDEVGTHDSVGRALWALGYGVLHAPGEAWRTVCRRLLDEGLRALEWLEHPRAQAYAALGLARAHGYEPKYAAELRYLAGALHARFLACRDAQWVWFEECMTYDNARLPEALLRCGVALAEPTYVEGGLEALAFYERVTFQNGLFVPIGNDGWYRRGAGRAVYGQQPLEAVSMIDVELAAYQATEDPRHRARAGLALAWYYGKNTREVTMAAGGGCYDGLHADSVNRNMGAESTLALLAGAYALARRRPRSLRVAR